MQSINKKSVIHGIAVLGTRFTLLKDFAEKQRGFGFPPDSLFINKSTKPLRRKNTSIVHLAKSSHYSTKITESSSCKELFEITNKLTSRNKYTPLPTTFSPLDLPDQFANFFDDKVQTI